MGKSGTALGTARSTTMSCCWSAAKTCRYGRPRRGHHDGRQSDHRRRRCRHHHHHLHRRHHRHHRRTKRPCRTTVQSRPPQSLLLEECRPRASPPLSLPMSWSSQWRRLSPLVHRHRRVNGGRSAWWWRYRYRSLRPPENTWNNKMRVLTLFHTTIRLDRTHATRGLWWKFSYKRTAESTPKELNCSELHATFCSEQLGTNAIRIVKTKQTCFRMGNINCQDEFWRRWWHQFWQFLLNIEITI